MCIFRAEQLEKEVAILKEKIHHLDDMLKSQQRKVRHMIEQVRNTNARLILPMLIFMQGLLTVWILCLLVFSSRTLAW